MNRAALLPILAISLTLASGLGATGAGANEDDDFQTRLFGRGLTKQKMHACFKRVYDAPHLAAHPKQNVRTMSLLVTADPGSGSPTYAIAIAVTFRKSGQHFDSYGDCGSIHDLAGNGPANTAHCGVECDGGSIDVAIKDKGSLLVSIPEGARLWRPGGDDDTGNARGRFGEDDKLFRLDKTKLTDCLSLASDEDKPALRKGQ